MNPGIFYRLLLSLTLLFLISTGTIAYSLINEAKDIYEKARLHQAHTMVQGLAQASLDALAVKDYELIEGWLRGTNAIDDFAYAYLSKANGLIISHTDIDLIAVQAESLGEIDAPMVRNISYLKRPVKEVVSPAFLGNKHLANVHLAYFTDTKSFYSEKVIIKISSLLLITLLVLLVVTSLLLRWVLKPIENLAVVMQKITQNKDYSTRVNLQRKDETGLLVNAFNTMLEQIQLRDSELITEKELALRSENEAKVYAHEVSITNNELENEISERIKIEYKLKELSDTLEQRVKERTKTLEELNKIISDVSRSAGMAEIANGVLHNVGNVLNSVNVSSSVIREKLRNTETRNLKKLVELLDANKENLSDFFIHDEKGSQIPRFLSLLADKQQQQELAFYAELDELDSNITHIKSIISMQQSYSGSFGVTECVKLPDLIDDAIKINMNNIQDFQFQIIKNIQGIADIHIDRHKVLQVVINLISNAKYALVDSTNNEKIMTISLSELDDAIVIEVKDTGVGILKEDISNLFNYGFSKRKNGHGFGLHHCALIASELNGSITVESDGLKKGASFKFYFKKES
jgi:two-component system, NtrC family, sensor kinase